MSVDQKRDIPESDTNIAGIDTLMKGSTRLIYSPKVCIDVTFNSKCSVDTTTNNEMRG